MLYFAGTLLTYTALFAFIITLTYFAFTDDFGPIIPLLFTYFLYPTSVITNIIAISIMIYLYIQYKEYVLSNRTLLVKYIILSTVLVLWQIITGIMIPQNLWNAWL